MNDDSSRLSDIPPLGRSVEEVESENANRVNPESHREDHRNGVDEVIPNNQTNLFAIPAAGPAAAGRRATNGADADESDRDLEERNSST